MSDLRNMAAGEPRDQRLDSSGPDAGMRIAGAGRYADRRCGFGSACLVALTAVGSAGGVSWVVMADPDGNEFCVLRPLTPEQLAAG